MVGVPRSNGCQTCLQRRVKCDLTQPECQQCTKRETKCPGYEKRWKFYNQTSGSMKKKPRSTQTPTQRGLLPVSSLVHPAASATSRSSIDERVEPNLAARAIDLQGKEVFCSFLLASFPAQFASCGGRVEVNWIDYARQPTASAPPQPLLWAFRSLSTLFVGRKNGDGDKVTCSRHMYSRALVYLADLVPQTTQACEDEVLAAAILLSIYEMQDSSSPTSWLAHARGLATIIQLRGPEAHRGGFGLTLLKSCRSLLVAEAFVRGGRCFLDKPEWKEFLVSLSRDENDGPKKSDLGLLVDRAFIETASCPGWLMRTREAIQARPGSDPHVSSSRQSLIREMTRSRDTLSDIRNQLEVSVSRQGTPVEDEAWEAFVGPIAWNFIDAFAHSSLYGIRLAISLIDHLLVLLRSHFYRERRDDSPLSDSSTDSISLVPVAINPWGGLGLDTSAWQVRFDTEYVQSSLNITPEMEDWMDRVAMSLGMLGIRS